MSPNEYMFAGNEDHYFSVGRSALECIDVCLRAAGTSPSDVKRILDLPCGHGRVTRYLTAAFPEAEITACDLLRDGVDFCASTFGAVPVYSEDDPHKIPLERGAFDLIWVGSLFTHLDSEPFSEFLRVFRDVLRPGGILIFTTHGRKAHRNILEGTDYDLPSWRVTSLVQKYQHDGFGFEEYLDAAAGTRRSRYGMTLSSPEWVIARTTRIDGLRVTHFSERAWDNHQDCIACIRDDSGLEDRSKKALGPSA